MEIKKTEKTKILIVTPNSGGPVTYTQILLKFLPQSGFGVRVVNFKDVEKYPKFLRQVVFIGSILKASKGAEIIYSQDPVSTGLPALIASKIAQKRFFLKIVGDYAWEQGMQRFGVKEVLDDFLKRNNYPFLVLLFRYIQTFVAKKAEKIIVPSEYLKGVVKQWGIDEKKISVIYNSFVFPDLNISRDEVRSKLGMNFPTIVSSARLVPWKGFDTLIEVFFEVQKKFSEAQLFILDDGPERSRLEKKVKDLGIDKNCHFVGRIPHNSVYEYIKGADVFALLSSYEGFSHLLLEAMALGSSIVTTPVGGNVEIVEDGINGVFVPYADVNKTLSAILNLLADNKIRNRLSIGGVNDVKRFSESQMIEGLVRVLR